MLALLDPLELLELLELALLAQQGHLGLGQLALLVRLALRDRLALLVRLGLAQPALLDLLVGQLAQQEPRDLLVDLQ